MGCEWEPRTVSAAQPQSTSCWCSCGDKEPRPGHRPLPWRRRGGPKKIPLTVEELDPETTHPAGPCHPGEANWMGPKSPKVPCIVVTWSWARPGRGAQSAAQPASSWVASPVTRGPALGLELCCGRIDTRSNFIFELVLCKCGQWHNRARA